MKSKWSQYLITFACFMIGAWMLLLMFSISHKNPGLNQTVMENMSVSGVTHPVTAVLLNFRAYDTLLEMGVILLALISTWSLKPAKEERTDPAGQVQTAYLRTVIPVLVVYAGYLLWIGSKEPGGAFQAGAMLAGSAIVVRFSGYHMFESTDRFATRIALSAGFGFFLLISFGLLLTGRNMLEYPLKMAGSLILSIEMIGTLSIGMALYGMFVGTRWPSLRKREE